MARPRTDDPEARARIIAAAEELFAEHGYAGTSIRDITRRAGVTSAMAHYYFGSKEHLYRSILETAVTTIRALIEEAGESREAFQPKLEKLIEAQLTYITSHAHLSRILFRELLAGGEHIVEIFERFPLTNYQLMRQVIAGGVRKKELRRLDVDLAPISLMGMIIVFQVMRPVIYRVLDKPTYDEPFIKRLSRHTAELFLDGAKRGAKEAVAEKEARTPKRQRAKGGKR